MKNRCFRPDWPTLGFILKLPRISLKLSKIYILISEYRGEEFPEADRKSLKIDLVDPSRTSRARFLYIFNLLVIICQIFILLIFLPKVGQIFFIRIQNLIPSEPEGALKGRSPASASRSNNTYL